ncbi:hypothetical protein BN2476_110069 [Paraburkholderia piptadeniae]|uniref:Uncharacterized protein n=1 Tax=Paraburkholderia piptadeniae TaxID=1701573 RepID=A0A1N7RPK4_9BURK|nr:hypothetical protein BN2476_110069 [Paraburkholderia piptadeniae]
MTASRDRDTSGKALDANAACDALGAGATMFSGVFARPVKSCARLRRSLPSVALTTSR